MLESVSVTDHSNTINILFSKLSKLAYKIDVNERAELLLQRVPNLYDQLIINLTNNILTNYLVFEDVAPTLLEEEQRHKNKEDMLTNSQQAGHY